MKVAVTGASGHIGNCLVRELKAKGANVKVLVHSFENDLAQLNVKLVHGSILSPKSLNQLCEGADVVFHLAAIIAIDNSNAELVYETNVIGTKNILEAAKAAKVKKFIHFSSIHAFQTKPLHGLLDEQRPLVETDKEIYGFTKAEGEKLVMNAAQEGLDALVLCPTAVIGPLDFRGSFLGKAIQQIYRNKYPMLISGGYNWVDVRDIVKAALQAIEEGRKGQKYILSGNYCELKYFSAFISKLYNRKTPTLIAPIFLVSIAIPFFKLFSLLTKQEPLFTKQSLDILLNAPRKISCQKAIDELGYNPRPLKDTLQDTIDWYKKNNALN